MILIAVLAALSAAAPVAGWLLVEDAINNGIRAGDDDRLVLAVLAYVGVNAAAWVLGTAGLARPRQRRPADRARARRPLPPPHLALAPLLLAAEGGLDHLAPEQRRRRPLGRPQPGPDDARRQHAHARRRRRPLPARLAARARRALHPPAGIVVTRWFQRVSHVAAADVRTRIAIVTAQLAESVAGMAVIQAFNRERAFQAEFDGLNEENRVANVRVQRIYSVFFPRSSSSARSRRGRALRGRAVHRRGSMEIGTLIAAVGLLALVFQPLQELSELYGQVQAASAAMDKISSVLDAEADVADKPARARSGGSTAGSSSTASPSRQGTVLHEIAISVPPGGCIALVGESGGGKSTTAKLIARFYDPDEGAVRSTAPTFATSSWSATGASSASSSRIRSSSAAPSPTTSASRSPTPPTRCGRPRRRRRRSVAAARARRRPRRRRRALGGRAQLISIARLLADPRILILDEATSNIDRPTEIVIEFDRLLAGRTSIIIAPPARDVRRADEILVLEHGRIVQRGTERELMEDRRRRPSSSSDSLPAARSATACDVHDEDGTGRLPAAAALADGAPGRGTRLLPALAHRDADRLRRGPESGEALLVGEQPGDREDEAGRPFVGPAGRSDEALAEAGIDAATSVTNAVKHFKWEPRGKRGSTRSRTQRDRRVPSLGRGRARGGTAARARLPRRDRRAGAPRPRRARDEGPWPAARIDARPVAFATVHPSRSCALPTTRRGVASEPCSWTTSRSPRRLES